MGKIIQILKKYKLAIILAFLSAFIIVFPQFFFRFDHQESYQGIDIIGTSDEKAYLARIREVRDGYFLVNNPYFKEGKDEPYIMPALGEVIVAYLGKIFFLDFNNTILLSRFLFPFLCFLAIYWFVFLLSKDKLTALISSMMVILGSILLSRFGIFQLLQGESPRTDFLIFTRPINPPVSSLFFFGFLIFFWLFLEKKQWWWGVLSATVLGLSFYVYFYTWSFLYAFSGIFIIIFLFQKRWQEIKRVILVILGGVLIAVPYFLNFYQTLINPAYLEMSQRYGLVENRIPTLGFLIPTILIIFLIFFPKKWKERFIFFLALVITPFVVLNQQLITGKTLINSHYHWYYHTPLAIIFLTIILFNLLPKWKEVLLKKITAIFMIGMSIYAGIFIQIASYKANEVMAVEEQRFAPIIQWLNKNTQKDHVIFADDEFSSLIVIYTPLNVFNHPTAKFYLGTPKERLINNLFLFYRLDEIGLGEAEEVFFKERAKISSAIFGEYYRQITGGRDYGGIPDEILQSFIQQYQDSLLIPAEEFFYQSLKKYGVNYLVWDKKLHPQWKLDQYSFLKEASQIDDFIIYQLD